MTRGTSALAEKRAEIMGMISRLRETKASPGGWQRPHRNGGGGGGVNGNANGHASSPKPSLLRPEESLAQPPIAARPKNGLNGLNGHGSQSGPTLAEALTLLERLDARLTRIEGELVRKGDGERPRDTPFKDPTFSGAIQGQMLSDMLQLVSSNQMSGIFIIENDMSSCTLYFDEGRICHAANGDTLGEDAFFAAFALGSGRYHFKETAELPPERTVSSGTQFLVLEALRRMDENAQK